MERVHILLLVVLEWLRDFRPSEPVAGAYSGAAGRRWPLLLSVRGLLGRCRDR